MTRATRTTVLRDKENATARNGRTAASRAKPPSTQAASEKPENVKPPGLARATASTAATRAKSVGVAAGKAEAVPQVKRKREALGEVPKPPENKAKSTAIPGIADLKGKEKVKEVKERFEGVVLKQTTTTTTVRKPLRTVVDSSTTTTAVATTRRTRNTTTSQPQPKELQPLREDEEDAMAVDPQPPAPVPSPKRFVAAREAVRTGVPAASRVPRRVSRPSKTEEDEEEASRVFKKRRTSSDMPDVDVDALHEEEVENAVVPKDDDEADPHGDQWVDLDAEDGDDPLMVSEYVVEIFSYLKEVEVCMRKVSYMLVFLTSYCALSKPLCRTPTTW